MDCTACDWTEKAERLYEDDKLIAILPKEAIAAGHIILMPKKHYTIIEQVPDYEMAHIAKVANKLSIALFESLKIQGTNILIQNGLAAHQAIPHLLVHIIPRVEGDNLNFQWKPRQLSEEEMSTIEISLKDASTGAGSIEKEKPKPIDLDARKPTELKAEPAKDAAERSEEINYLIRQLERIP